MAYAFSSSAALALILAAVLALVWFTRLSAKRPIMGLMPDRLEKLALKFFGLKATAVMTNVPGPTRPVFIAGRPMRNAIFWGEHSHFVGVLPGCGSG